MASRFKVLWFILPLFYFPQGLPAMESQEVRALLDDAQDLLDHRQPEEALRLFRKAAKKAGSGCLDCSLGLARSYRQVGAYRDALKYAQQALDLEPQASARAVACSEVGLAHLGLGEKGSPDVAAEHFRKAIDHSEVSSPSLFYNLGVSLLKAGRDEEGVVALEKLLELEAHTSLAREARSLIREPRRAREDLVPDFTAATLEGRSLSPEDLAGKVVLYDFWATWCGPCHQALPSLRRLHKKMEDTPFVLVSISTDRDEAKLRNFVDREEMIWPQVHDRSGEVTGGAFNVRSFPTYILVDHEGRIIFRRSGWSPGIDMEVTMRVRKAMKRARKSEEAPGR